MAALGEGGRLELDLSVPSGEPRAVHSGRLERQPADAQARVRALETSWSWRLTLPLRLAGGIALRLARRIPNRPG